MSGDVAVKVTPRLG